jgi:hypothetical protein
LFIHEFFFLPCGILFLRCDVDALARFVHGFNRVDDYLSRRVKPLVRSRPYNQVQDISWQPRLKRSMKDRLVKHAEPTPASTQAFIRGAWNEAYAAAFSDLES